MVNCDPNELMAAAKCFRCIPKGLQRAVQLYLLCQIVKKKNEGPVVAGLEWTPHNVQALWVDGTGPHTTDWDTFNTTALKASVTSLDFTVDPFNVIDTLTGLSTLPNLQTVAVDANNLVSLDASNCLSLVTLTAQGNLLTSVLVTNDAALQTLSLSGNILLASIDVTTCTALLTLLMNSCALTQIDVTQCTQLDNLDLGFNALSPLFGLDVSQNTILTQLDCTGNALDALDISACTIMQFLFCGSQFITNTNATVPTYILNRILVDLASTGIQNGTVDTSLQTPLAPPSSPGGGEPDGIAAVATLLGYGLPWTVTTD